MDAKEFSQAKADLRNRLTKLRDELNQYLAGEYGIDAHKPKLFQNWRETHHPFHWLAEFYGIMSDGGFDVIIGNPPWIEYAKVKKEYTVHNYQTEACGNLHALCVRVHGLGRLKARGFCSSDLCQLGILRLSDLAEIPENKGFHPVNAYHSAPSAVFRFVRPRGI
jgi:hypothetical protein